MGGKPDDSQARAGHACLGCGRRHIPPVMARSPMRKLPETGTVDSPAPTSRPAGSAGARQKKPSTFSTSASTACTITFLGLAMVSCCSADANHPCGGDSRRQGWDGGASRARASPRCSKHSRQGKALGLSRSKTGTGKTGVREVARSYALHIQSKAFDLARGDDARAIRTVGDRRSCRGSPPIQASTKRLRNARHSRKRPSGGY